MTMLIYSSASIKKAHLAIACTICVCMTAGGAQEPFDILANDSAEFAGLEWDNPCEMSCFQNSQFQQVHISESEKEPTTKKGSQINTALGSTIVAATPLVEKEVVLPRFMSEILLSTDLWFTPVPDYTFTEINLYVEEVLDLQLAAFFVDTPNARWKSGNIHNLQDKDGELLKVAAKPINPDSYAPIVISTRFMFKITENNLNDCVLEIDSSAQDEKLEFRVKNWVTNRFELMHITELLDCDNVVDENGQLELQVIWKQPRQPGKIEEIWSLDHLAIAGYRQRERNLVWGLQTFRVN